MNDRKEKIVQIVAGTLIGILLLACIGVLVWKRLYRHSGEVGGLTWEITEYGVLTLTGSAEDGWGDKPWWEYREQVTEVHMDVTGAQNLENFFFDFTNLERVDLSGLDTSEVTDMNCMFYGCESLKTLDLSGFDTGNVTNMRSMFADCKSLMTLDVSGFDTSNVTDMRYMFFSCEALESVDLSSWDTGNVTDMSYMFDGCENLTEIIGEPAWKMKTDL